jgi:hypothetical protein
MYTELYFFFKGVPYSEIFSSKDVMVQNEGHFSEVSHCVEREGERGRADSAELPK